MNRAVRASAFPVLTLLLVFGLTAPATAASTLQLHGNSFTVSAGWSNDPAVLGGTPVPGTVYQTLGVSVARTNGVVNREPLEDMVVVSAFRYRYDEFHSFEFLESGLFVSSSGLRLTGDVGTLGGARVSGTVTLSFCGYRGCPVEETMTIDASYAGTGPTFGGREAPAVQHEISPGLFVAIDAESFRFRFGSASAVVNGATAGVELGSAFLAYVQEGTVRVIV